MWPINNELTELVRLKKPRTRASFQPKHVQQVAGAGRRGCQRTDALVGKASEQFKFRQMVSVVSMAIGLLMLAIYLSFGSMEE